MELIKKDDRWDLYNEDGHKIASTLDGCLNKLSLKNCEAIENGYDLDELADECQNILIKDNWRESPSQKIAFTLGFQKALELVEHRLSKETEWQVEIVMDICGDKVYAVPEPALDKQGCLILKRIDN